ncbi:hypothetical protein HYZ99_01395 [Candidatus Peregrinibacteria bacterium]|nr:hypothetical protein [Candidatus Peregrinibacteria bacterium]
MAERYIGEFTQMVSAFEDLMQQSDLPAIASYAKELSSYGGFLLMDTHGPKIATDAPQLKELYAQVAAKMRTWLSAHLHLAGEDIQVLQRIAGIMNDRSNDMAKLLEEEEEWPAARERWLEILESAEEDELDDWWKRGLGEE